MFFTESQLKSVKPESAEKCRIYRPSFLANTLLKDHSIDYKAAAAGTTWLWGLKFNSTDERNEHIQKQVNMDDRVFAVYAKIMNKYQNGEVPYSQRFTWDAFTQYLADKANFDEEDNNHHWRTSTYQCGVSLSHD